MATDQRQSNMQINSFNKGMNSDVSYDLTQEGQYVFGKNIRITNNTLYTQDPDSNTTEGIVTAVPSGVQVNNTDRISEAKEILSIATLENIGAIVIKKNDDRWAVYKMNYDQQNNSIHYTYLFTSSETVANGVSKLSTVLYKELEGVTKLYIADTKHPIMAINIEDDEYARKLRQNDGYPIEDKLSSNRIFPDDKITIKDKIPGQLKTSQVQYTYRFYKKYGPSSVIAPVTNKIQVIDSNRRKEIGNAYNTLTSIGFQLEIPVQQVHKNVFDHIQVFRIQYVKAGDLPTISLIYEAQLSNDNIIVNDTGLQSLKDYSQEEFSDMRNQTLIPTTIEQSNGYMFGSNIKDESMLRLSNAEFDARAYQCNTSGNYVLYKDTQYTQSQSYTSVDSIDGSYELNSYSDINTGEDVLNPCCFGKFDNQLFYGGNGKNVSWRFVVAKIPIHENYGTDKNIVPTVQSNINTNVSYINSYDNLVQSQTTTNDCLFDSKLPCDDKVSYENIFTSSGLRSLRRDEVYRYGIILYDKNGVRSETMWIADIRTPSVNQCPITKKEGNENNPKLYAMSLGIEFYVTVNTPNIVGYEIVRCDTDSSFSSVLTQCVISRPVRQRKITRTKNGDFQYTSYSPYYPTALLTSKHSWIRGYGALDGSNSNYVIGNGKPGGQAWGPAYSDVDNLFQVFNPEIQIYRNDMVDLLSEDNVMIHPLQYVWGDLINKQRVRLSDHAHDSLKSLDFSWQHNQFFGTGNYSNEHKSGDYVSYDTTTMKELEYSGTDEAYPISSSDGPFCDYERKNVGYLVQNCQIWQHRDQEKSSNELVEYYYNYVLQNNQYAKYSIEGVSDVKNPNWNDGYVNIQLDGDRIISGIKQYKAYLSSFNGILYNNWVSSGMYDLRVSPHESQEELNNYGGTSDDENGKGEQYYTSLNYKKLGNASLTFMPRIAWQGPGPQCLLIKTEEGISNNILMQDSQPIGTLQQPNYMSDTIGTALCNIKHTAIQFAGLLASQKQYDVYYGFGDYTKLNSSRGTSKVFNGNIYITPSEIVTMFKTYNFNSYVDTLRSNQVVYYVPMESTVNTFFDYGMNHRNTVNPNLQLEPGNIDGIASQDRPIHQYNSIYSSNDTSMFVYNAKLLEDAIEVFPQRIIYSEHKINGDDIDVWGIYRPADYIDADSKYGEVTALLNTQTALYYWQTTAFGKLSVNERSLVQDQNSNTIQLGQGDVLQRTDYIDTNHGMRKYDYSHVNASNEIYWIDVDNKTIMCNIQNSVADASEVFNVQNIVNKNFSVTVSQKPIISYDLQNNEVLCKCFGNDQIVFNNKYKMFTSVYTRNYDDVATFNNTIIGLKASGTGVRYNNLSSTSGYLTPQVLTFIVNSQPSITKVFDDQKVVTMKRNYDANFVNTYFTNIHNIYSTDLNTAKSKAGDDCITDREGNIQYPIARQDDSYYGDRVRGKWMKVEITNSKPTKDFAISHILTKFRQSYT